MEKITEFIANIMIAMSNCCLYGREHPAVMYLSEKAVTVLDSLYLNDCFSIALLGEKMVVNEQSFAVRSIHVSSFVKKLARKGIDKVVITKGVTADELRDFFSEVALSDRVAATYPHITSGVMEVKLDGGGGGDVSAVVRENIGKVKEVYHGVSRFKRLDTAALENVVSSFITTLRQETNILKVVSPIKAHSEYTYAHNTNVAILSIFQAESLGFRNDLIHDIGLAGLLHDIGKMFVAREVLDKEAKLDNEEWTEMKKHPVRGAMYLATQPDIPKFALVATYEHHMKFNGKGYPETKRKGGGQHVVSQIIAISDVFDALRADRPYRKSLTVPVITGLMTESAGKDFNPLLVDNFVQSLKRVTATES